MMAEPEGSQKSASTVDVIRLPGPTTLEDECRLCDLHVEECLVCDVATGRHSQKQTCEWRLERERIRVGGKIPTEKRPERD